jgi:branched-chain amino acid aminotransferase
MLNEQGQIAEGASANVFAVRGGELLTPPLDAGILAGITREIVLELAAQLDIGAREAILMPHDLLEADEAFITSSLKEVAPIARVDGQPIGGGKPGRVTLRLLTAYREFAQQHRAA